MKYYGVQICHVACFHVLCCCRCCCLSYPLPVTSLPPHSYLGHLEKLFQYLLWSSPLNNLPDSTVRFDHASFLTSYIVCSSTITLTTVLFIFCLWKCCLSVDSFHCLACNRLLSNAWWWWRWWAWRGVHSSFKQIWRNAGLGHMQRKVVDTSLSPSVPSTGCCCSFTTRFLLIYIFYNLIPILSLYFAFVLFCLYP